MIGFGTIIQQSTPTKQVHAMPNPTDIAKALAKLQGAGAKMAGAAKRIQELEAEARKIVGDFLMLLAQTDAFADPTGDPTAALVAAQHYLKQIQTEIDAAKRDLQDAMTDYQKALADLAKAAR